MPHKVTLITAIVHWFYW